MSGPIYHIIGAEVGAKARQLLARHEHMIAQINHARSEVSALVEHGYTTPAAREKFSPYFTRFADGAAQTIDGLTGIAEYLKIVVDAFGELDTNLGTAFDKKS